MTTRPSITRTWARRPVLRQLARPHATPSGTEAKRFPTSHFNCDSVPRTFPMGQRRSWRCPSATRRPGASAEQRRTPATDRTAHRDGHPALPEHLLPEPDGGLPDVLK